MSPAVRGIGADSANGRALRVATAAVIGGTASKIGGGSFANGAITGAFVQAYNDEMANRQQVEAARKAREQVFAYGINVGLSGAGNPFSKLGGYGSLSLAALLDTEGNFVLTVNYETGIALSSKPTAGLFANAVVGNTLATDYIGSGTSINGGAGPFNAAIAIPDGGNFFTSPDYSTYGASNVFLEVGGQLSTPGAVIAGARADTLASFSTSALGDAGRWIGRTTYELTHPDW